MSRTRIVAYLCSLILFLSGGGILASAREKSQQGGAKLTVDRVREMNWWPTSGKPDRSEYAGAAACARCHRSISDTQTQTRMAHAASRPSQASVLQLSPQMTADKNGYKTTITTDSRRTTYSVSRGAEALSSEVAWSLGDGKLGSTFLLSSGALLLESQLSYFTAEKGLDLTPGHSQSPFSNVQQAFGEPQTPEVAARCLGCHTTGSSQRGRFKPNDATPGITCEACHGPGMAHVKAMEGNRVESGRESIVNPGALSPVEQLDFCGACHRATRDITDVKDFTAVNIRFQPYRLSKSRCWSKPDARLACTACHDPHLKLNEEPASYDSKCLACHANREHDSHAESPGLVSSKERACPVGKRDCVKCHMPRYNLPQLHGAFTDHDIRIVLPHEKFPL